MLATTHPVRVPLKMSHTHTHLLTYEPCIVFFIRLESPPVTVVVPSEWRHLTRGERVIITNGKWKGHYGTFVKRNGSTSLVDVDNVAVRGIFPEYIQPLRHLRTEYLAPAALNSQAPDSLTSDTPTSFDSHGLITSLTPPSAPSASPRSSPDSHELLFKISQLSLSFLFFVDADNSADLVPKHFIPFLEATASGHVLSCLCESHSPRRISVIVFIKSEFCAVEDILM